MSHMHDGMFFCTKKKRRGWHCRQEWQGERENQKITNQRHVKNLRWRTESLSLLHGSNGDFHSFCCIIALPSKHTWLYKAEAHFYVSSLRAYVLHAMRGRIASACNLRYTQGLNAMLYSGQRSLLLAIYTSFAFYVVSVRRLHVCMLWTDSVQHCLGVRCKYT